jgi:[acyl-carrier-protein] S-malonyltransferase
MGREWAEGYTEAAATFEEADRILGYPLSRLCWEGPEEELNRTANTQPALLVASTAVHRVLRRTGLAPVAVAGHSLGEYSALVAAGALAFEDALRLVRRRGELMQEAVPLGEGAMAAIMGLDAVVVAELAVEAEQGQVCSVANYNSPLQTVIAGNAAAVERAMELARQRGARKVVALPVSAPFHCALMAPAREAMAELLSRAGFADPVPPVVSNVDARAVSTGADARDALIRQIDAPVRWTESVQLLSGALAVEEFLEVGPGKVLTGIVRRIAQDARVTPLSESEALPVVVERLGLEPVLSAR